MSSREKILAAIIAAKPPAKELPDIDMQQVTNYDDRQQKFISTLEGIGGRVEEIAGAASLQALIEADKKHGKFILDAVTGSTGEIVEAQTASLLEPLYKAYIKGEIGVAENGAVWITGSQMGNRLLPFICQHLVVVLEKEKLVSTMHHAYEQVNSFGEGFGVFIAGPSKTADIEQSLVIGAHGARSMTVLLVN